MRRGAIVVCGGQSHRMGLAKASLPFGPERMLQRVVRLVGRAVGPIVVVAAPGQDIPELPEDVALARDRRQGRGPLEGLATGLAGIRQQADAVFVTGCDVPLLVPAFVDRLFQLLGDHDIVVPKEGAFFHPLAAVYRTGVLADVDALLASAQLRPALLFDRMKTLEVPVDRLRDVDPQLATLQNLNRPEDYIEALRRGGFPVPGGIAERLAKGGSEPDGERKR